MEDLQAQITLNMRTAGQVAHDETLGYLHYNLLDSADSDVSSTAATVKSFGQAIAGLTIDTYIDMNIRYDVSINEF